MYSTADSSPQPPPTADRTRSRLGRAWVVAVLGLAAAVIALMERDRTDPTAPADLPLPLAERDADMLLEGADITQLRDDGTLQYHLLAERIRLYEADAVTDLTAPTMSLHSADGPPWVASARRGSLQRMPPPGTEEVVYLREDVVLERIRVDGDRMRLTTSALDLYPGRQYAETDQDVMIESHVGRTTATGLEGDFQLGKLRLFSSAEAPVYTVLDPEHFK